VGRLRTPKATPRRRDLAAVREAAQTARGLAESII